MRTLLLGLVAIATACTLFTPQLAQAWHKEGHMAVALIAYRQLDEAEQTKVQEILKKHPHYDIFLSAGATLDANLDEWVVMQAAIWPDWIKSPTIKDKAKRAKIISDFNNGDWHYVNEAITYLDGATDAEKAVIKATINDTMRKKGEIMEKFPQLVAGFKGQNGVDLTKLVWANKHEATELTKDQARAIALCWILHLVGDIHQPLHAAALFSKDSPEGDRGGNAFFVRWDNQVVDLHTIFDGGFGWDRLKAPHGSQFELVDGLAHDLLARIKPTKAQKAEMDFTKWKDESLKLAETKVYFPNGKFLPGVFLFGKHPHLPAPDELDELPTGYEASVKKIAEQRVTLAGYRMGTLLNELVK